ncbi:MAG: circularly permuted type 2 ATP-grasp protein [Polaromonas sp.]|uniref:circularly permuted type 2 ATP-grasp protein n=1 Tax=Polaromonas sp. TaxID=1869339 RepID=UPI002733532A|nr:circularly permuted type 2 ATP-grasp protein [Polaromonas sp.]MDP2818119.1 circularly permuted type 2 ATP-grasp protein [Polaromonas sp.]
MLDKPSPAPSQSQQQSQFALHLAGTAPVAAALPTADPASPPPAKLAPDWHRFFNFLGGDGFDDLSHRTANLHRQIRDNGVTYNVYADANGPQRPWSLDLFPLLLSAQDWTQIARGITQRARLLDRIMADVYGPQQLLSLGLLPTALVQGHPGYLRAMHGVQPAGGTFLHIAAFDLARGPDGRWWVVSQRTQAPSGLGYLLENRLTISRLFPQAFREMKVQALAASYKALIDGMKAHSPAGARGEDSRIVLLTPGPYNETYFEHAYLARYLGLTLVEGSDLLVRDDKLYLKTLQGLEPVHGLLKRLDDEFLDPLELRSDSTLGVPGLLQAIRAGNVLVTNTPGSAFLESSALLGFLPALSRHLLDQPLAMPSLATWWCGEQAALQSVLPRLKECVIKATYPNVGSSSVIAQTLSSREIDEWAGRLVRRSEDYTVQAYLPLSQTPTWQGQRIAPRSTMLRVFAVADGAGSWQVLPGGLARLAGVNAKIASMQQGGSSADVWVVSSPAAAPPATNTGTTVPAGAEPGAAPQVWTRHRHKPAVTSRAAENLFWLGRYTERTENAIRMARLTLQSLNGEDQSSQPLLAWLSELAVKNGLVLDTVPPATQARRVFERSLIASLADTEQAASVGYNLRALKGAASAVRERLSQEQWHVIVRAEEDFFRRCESFSGPDHPATQALEYSSVEALRALESASSFLAAMTGAQTDRMSRDDGWRLLSTGRHIERLHTLSAALILGFETGAVHDEGGFDAMLALFDSTITFHAQYQQQRDIPALLDLLVLDRDNPRSLGWVTQTLRGRLARLAENTAGKAQAPELTQTLPDPGSWILRELCIAAPGAAQDQPYASLLNQLARCCEAAFDLSDLLSRRYFSHVAQDEHSLGA